MKISHLLKTIEPAAALVAKHSKSVKVYLAAGAMVAEGIRVSAEHLSRAAGMVNA